MAYHKSSNVISYRILKNQTLLDAFICHCVCSFHIPFSVGYIQSMEIAPPKTFIHDGDILLLYSCKRSSTMGLDN
jgi:hypothetical protein